MTDYAPYVFIQIQLNCRDLLFYNLPETIDQGVSLLHVIEWIKKRLWPVIVLASGWLIWLFGDLGPEPANVRELVSENWRWIFPVLRWMGVFLICLSIVRLIKENTDAVDRAAAIAENLTKTLNEEREERVNSVRGVQQSAEEALEIAGPSTSRLTALESRMTAVETRARLLEEKRQSTTNETDSTH